jgi:hypothetical protein
MTNSPGTTSAGEGRDLRTEPRNCGVRALDRRTFLGRLTLTAGAAVAGQFVSLSIARAVVQARPGEGAPHGAGARAAAAADGDWHVDDICGHWPRYAHPIPFAQAQSATVAWEGVDPVDLALLSREPG